MKGNIANGVVTSHDVASKAQVSQATVSRVFNRRSYVKPDTIRRVMDAAKELGYMPNAIARSLISNKTNIIAVVTVNFNNPFYQTYLIKISNMLNSMGKKMMFIQSPFEQELYNIIYEVMQYKVDGIIVMSAAISSKDISEFNRIPIPLVIFNKHFKSKYFYSVCSDNVAAGEMVAQYLIDKNYKSFGFISGDILKQTSEFRFRGYSGRLAKNGFDCKVASGDLSYNSGYNAMLSMALNGGLPEAIFCVNDLMAFGAMDAARYRLNLRVPEDIAFVGFDNLEQCSWNTYSLTSVKQPIDQMIDYSRSFLGEKLLNTDTPGGFNLLDCELIERSSS